MRDKRDAARPEARIAIGAGNLRAEFGRELAPDGRDIDPDLLEDAAAQDRHGPAAAALALPGPPLEAAGLALRGPPCRILRLDRFEGGADPVAQLFKPIGGPLLGGGRGGEVSGHVPLSKT